MSGTPEDIYRRVSDFLNDQDAQQADAQADDDESGEAATGDQPEDCGRPCPAFSATFTEEWIDPTPDFTTHLKA